MLAGDFVTAEEGTGIVHMAPGFGEDDQQVCEAAGIAVVVPVNDEGSFTSEVHMWEGQNVFEANSAIISELRSRGALFRHDSIEHSYPYCWRTDTPIIYRAMNSWYVEVTAIRDRMVRAQPADQLDTRPCPRRQVRQMAGRRQRLVDQPQPLLGRADTCLAQRQSGFPKS